MKNKNKGTPTLFLSRRHSTLGYLSPTTFLQNWIERQDQQEMAA